MTVEPSNLEQSEISQDDYHEALERLAIVPLRWIILNKNASTNPEIAADEKFIESQDRDIQRLSDSIEIIRKAIPIGSASLAWILNTTLAWTIGALMQNDSEDTDIYDNEAKYILSQLPIQLITDGLIDLERSELEQHQFETLTKDLEVYIARIAIVWRSYYADALQNKSYTMSEAYTDDFIQVQLFIEFMCQSNRHDVIYGLRVLMASIAWYVVADRRVVEPTACDNLAKSFFNKVVPDGA